MTPIESVSWVEIVEKAWVRKQPLLSDGQTLRIVNGVYSGLPGLAMDWYAGHLVLFAYGEAFWGLDSIQVLPLVKAISPKSISLKDRTQRAGDNREVSRLLWGEAPERVMVLEGDLKFWIEIAHAHNVGLFLDTRPIRVWLKQFAHGKVLNLFSYTCSLGLAAAQAGAETINVDISKRYLEWGRDNYHENGLPNPAASFKGMPAERYLDWASKKGLQFQGVILDPPSFSRFEGKVFSLGKDYARLVEKAAKLVEIDGFLMAMTNFADASPDRMRSWISPGLKNAGWEKVEWVAIEPGPDFDPPSTWYRTEEGMLSGWRIHRKSA